MEALVALGLVCNIVQLAGTATKAVVLTKQIYENGASVEQLDFKTNCGRLRESCSTLAQELENSQQDQDVQVRDIANKYLKTSEELDKVIRKLEPLSSAIPAGKFQRLGKAVKSPWRMKRINEIKVKLDEYQKFIDTHILVQLSLRIRESGVCNRATFPIDNQQLKVVAMELDAGQSTTIDLFKVVQQDLTDVQAQIRQAKCQIDEVKKLQISESEEKALKEFEASLSFSDMFARQEAIDERCKTTFEWIFSHQDHFSWPSFANWLTSNDQFYWLLGKPGSGKSTLMNFIVDDSRTRGLLACDAAEPPIMANFFFWEAGSPLQRSVSGMLRSLLLQLLRGPDKATLRDWIAKESDALFETSTWTSKRLLHTLEEAQRRTSRRMCYFIDGMDECDDPEALIKVMQVIKSNPKVKICASSRPLHLFELKFGDCSQLKLQDLTRSDVETYTRRRLSEGMSVCSNESWNASIVEEFTQQISVKAEGVFLWVKLVVNFLLQGFRNGDEPPLLYKRLQALPEDIFDLYHNMWRRTKSEHALYEGFASLYFHLILIKEISLVSFALALDEDLQHNLLQEEKLRNDRNFESSLADYSMLRLRLMIRCAGLLEILDTSKPTPEAATTNPTADSISIFGVCHLPAEDVRTHKNTKIVFIHRTAREFLLQDVRGQSILAILPDGQYGAWRRQCRTFLIERVLSLTRISSNDYARFSDSFFGVYSDHAERFYEESKQLSAFSMTALFEETFSRIVAYRAAVPRKNWIHWLFEKEYSLGAVRVPDDTFPWFLDIILRTTKGQPYTGFEFVIRSLRDPTSSYDKASLSNLLGRLFQGHGSKVQDLTPYATVLQLLLERGADPNHVFRNEYARRKTPLGYVFLSAKETYNPWLEFLKTTDLSRHEASFEMLLAYGADPSGFYLCRCTRPHPSESEIVCILSTTALQVIQDLRHDDTTEPLIEQLVARGAEQTPDSRNRFVLLKLGNEWSEVTPEDSSMLVCLSESLKFHLDLREGVMTFVNEILRVHARSAKFENVKQALESFGQRYSSWNRFNLRLTDQDYLWLENGRRQP